MMETPYERLDATDTLQKKALASMVELGKRYLEIARCQCMPDIGGSARMCSAISFAPHTGLRTSANCGDIVGSGLSNAAVRTSR